MLYMVKDQKNKVLLTTDDFYYAESFAWDLVNRKSEFVEILNEKGTVLAEMGETEPLFEQSL